MSLPLINGPHNSWKNISPNVIYMIFSYYGEEETDRFPLETLLLVCRFWRAIALEHKRIWTIFNIYLKEKHVAELWSRKVARRLGYMEQNGSRAPIVIALSAGGHRRCEKSKCRKCDTQKVINQYSDLILRYILGSDGSLCARWQKLKLCNIRIGLPFLSNPTPDLESLHLEDVIYYQDTQILPSVPLLRNIHIYFGTLPNLPDLSSVQNIYIATAHAEGSLNMAPLLTAVNVQYLNLDLVDYADGLYIYPDFKIAKQLPFLVSLTLSQTCIPTNLTRLKIPALRQLRLKFELLFDDYLEELLQCDGIPFENLEVLGLSFSGLVTPDLTEVLHDTCTNLLQSCIKLRRLEGSEISTAILLKLMYDICKEKKQEAESSNENWDHFNDSWVFNTIVMSSEVISRELRPQLDDKIEDILQLDSQIGWHELDLGWDDWVLDVKPRQR